MQLLYRNIPNRITEQTPSTHTVSFLERDACVRLTDAEAEEKRRNTQMKES